MHKNPSYKLTALYISIIAVVVLVMTVLIFEKYNALEVLSTIRNIDYIFVFVGISMIFLQLYSEAFCFKILFSLLGKKISVFSASGYAGTDLLYSNISPAQIAGLPAAGYTMFKDGISPSLSCSVLPLYSMCNRIAVVVVALASVVVFPILLSTGSALFSVLLIYGAILNLALVSVFAVVIFAPDFAGRIIPYLLKKASKFKVLHLTDEKICSACCGVEKYISAAKVMRKSPFTVLLVIAICVFKRIVNFAIVYWTYLAFGLRDESFSYVIALQSVLAVSSELVPVPGAAGVTENVFTILYSGVFGPRLYIAAMIVSRFLNFFVLLAVSGSYALIYKFWGKRGKDT